ILSCLLLALTPDGLLRALARARVGAGALTADGEAPALPEPAVAADLHQPLDVRGALAAEVALDREVRVDVRAQPRDLGVREVANPGGLSECQIAPHPTC